MFFSAERRCVCLLVSGYLCLSPCKIGVLAVIFLYNLCEGRSLVCCACNSPSLLSALCWDQRIPGGQLGDGTVSRVLFPKATLGQIVEGDGSKVVYKEFSTWPLHP